MLDPDKNFMRHLWFSPLPNLGSRTAYAYQLIAILLGQIQLLIRD